MTKDVSGKGQVKLAENRQNPIFSQNWSFLRFLGLFGYLCTPDPDPFLEFLCPKKTKNGHF